MKYVSETVGTTYVVTLLDETLDTRNAKEFRRVVEAELAGRRSAVLDLARVRVVDSSGLGAILGCVRVIGGGGGGLRLCGLSPDVRKAIELVRMDWLLDIHDTRADALAAIRDAAALGLKA
jgi:anti-sigma B factor antagonist